MTPTRGQIFADADEVMTLLPCSRVKRYKILGYNKTRSKLRNTKERLSMSLDIQQYSQTLADMGIAHEVVDHPKLQTPPDVQHYLGLTLADGLATMIMKAADSFIVVIRRCDMRLSSKKVKKLVGSKLRIASPEEFTQITGLPIGTARVYVPGLPTYLDENLFQKDYLTSGSGSFTCSIRVKSEDLKKLPNSQVVAISE